MFHPNYSKHRLQVEDQQRQSDKTHKVNLAKARMKDRMKVKEEKRKIDHLYNTKQISADKANNMWASVKKQYRHVM